MCVETASRTGADEADPCFNAARSIVCVETINNRVIRAVSERFNAARSIVCVETVDNGRPVEIDQGFNAARSIVCVETIAFTCVVYVVNVSMPHAALCVSRRCVPQPLSRAG